MQKKLIALAVAGLASGAAFAQTNVTLYGVADAGYVYSSGSAGHLGPVNIGGNNVFSGIVSGLLSGSRLGFRGEENLGNGLKAVFTLEYALNLDTNTGVGASGGLNARQQFVGLSGEKWGMVAFGRQYAPGYLATARNDPYGGALFEPQSFLSQQAGNSITPNSAARWDNAMTYTSPNWNGFQAKAIYAFGETQGTYPVVGGLTYNDKTTSVSDNGKWALGFNYANGPINADLVYQQREHVTTNIGVFSGLGNGFPAVVTNQFNANGKSVNELYVGGSYDFKAAKVMASWQGQNDRNDANLDNQIWSVGVVIPVLQASNIHLAWSELLWDQGHDNLGINRPLNGNSQAASLGWSTALSKRTTLYAGYVWVRNDNDSTPSGPVAGTDVTGARGQTNNTFLAGINHAF